jgi:phage gpG-like protein
MSPDEFTRLINRKAKEVKAYVTTRFPAQAGDTALRFINGNFRAQGWQGATFQPWKPNKRGGRILVQKGHLRAASFYYTAPGMAIIRNTLKYAAIHNEGGNVQIPVTHKMRKFAWAMYAKNGGKGKPKAERWKTLALTKKTYLNINIAQRQFAPTPTSQSQVLNAAVTRKIEQELKTLFPNQ